MCGTVNAGHWRAAQPTGTLAICGACRAAVVAAHGAPDRYGRVFGHCPNCQLTTTWRIDMPCDTRLKPRQTITERKEEVRRAVEKLSRGLAAGTIKPKVGPQGAIAFADWLDSERDGVTDACAYRRLMVEGSALARAAITRAEQLAGRTVDKQALAHGHHSHDGGRTWHHGH